ncbi:MAG: uridine kinase [Clostridia bacterium]|nr:uridine kinase [Clostridia bacterium]
MAGKIIVRLPDNVVKKFNPGTSVLEVLGTGKEPGEPLVAIVNGEVAELSKKLYQNATIQPVTINSPLGFRTYEKSLCFLLIKAVNEVLSGARVTIEHSLSKGLYGEIHYNRKINEKDIELIKEKMKEIVSKDEKIEKIKMSKEECKRIFKSYGMKDRLRLLKYIELDYINMYKCGNLYDYFYGPLVPSMGYLNLFDLKLYAPGFILMYPHPEDPETIAPYKDLPKLAKVFRETEKWARILDIADVASLNDKVSSEEINDIILVNEALHEKRIAKIADKIYENKDRIKIVLIAGPSSSGKTTFANRLSIQLKVLGLKPYPISLDDYFVDREYTPLDEKGEYDFESINALDLELFNKHLMSLLNGDEIELVRYNFITGHREWTGKKYKMGDNSVLIIEGIHGLNETLTSSIPKENKFKIYISALTQLNIDNHNRIPTTDVRKLRRIVRDYNYRGRSAEKTITTWHKVREGEEKNIFPFQEEADTMFNSTLVYEMSILKKYAEPLLREIPKDSPAYIEAKRLLILLRYFKTANEEKVIPNNSIIREFIGGSVFHEE